MRHITLGLLLGALLALSMGCASRVGISRDIIHADKTTVLARKCIDLAVWFPPFKIVVFPVDCKMEVITLENDTKELI